MNKQRCLAAVCLLLEMLLAGCGTVVGATDASNTSDAMSTDGTAMCAPPPPRTVPQVCTALRDLAANENRATDPATGLVSYRVQGLSAERNNARPACSSSVDGSDVSVRFTAPQGGQWRLIAEGEGLRSLTASRGCDGLARCSSFDAYEGAHVSPTIVLDVFAERGETFSVLLDGCTAGQSCSYNLRAERVGALRCPGYLEGDNPCASVGRCTINACDEERFTCVRSVSSNNTVTRLASATLQFDPEARYGLFSARLQDTPDGAVSGPISVLAEWIRPDGSVADRTFSDTFTAIDGAIAPTLKAYAPNNGERLRVWVLSPMRSLEANRADAILITPTPLPRLAEGAVCDLNSSTSFCPRGSACVATEANTSPRCTRATQFAITSLAVFKRQGNTLSLRIEGTRMGNEVSQALVALLDATGTVVGSELTASLLSALVDPTGANFRESALDLRVAPEVFSRAVRARVRVVSTDSMRSAPVETTIQMARTVGVAASCSEVGTQCSEGLTCVPNSAGAQCEPSRRTRVCNEQDTFYPLWTPPRAGTYTITGRGEGRGRDTSCDVSRSGSTTRGVFIAPNTGRYLFELEGLTSFETGTATQCMTPSCAMIMGPMSVAVELERGSAMFFRAASPSFNDPFSIRVRVP